MPLEKSKSDQARSRNIGREINAGRPPAQAAAIAYSVQRKAEHKGRKVTEEHGGKSRHEAINKKHGRIG